MRDAGTEGIAREDEAGDLPRVDPASVLVAIPTLNEAAHIEATLRALHDGDSDMAAVSVVVADGGSTDATREIVAAFAEAHPNVRLIDNPDRLQAAAVNRAVECCATPQHTALVRVDAHSHYPPGYVMDVVRTMRARSAAAVATVMDSGGDSCFQRGLAWASDTKLGSGGSGHRGGTVSGWVDHGHHAGFDLETFRAVGGYDTGFVANEDAELDHRIALAGGGVWLEAGIRIGYVVRPDLRRLARQYWRYGRGRGQTVLKHGIRPRLRQMVPPAAVVGNTMALLLAPILPWALLVPALYLAAIAATVAGLVLRRRSVCALWAGPALAAMHHAWGAGFLWQMARGRP